jgi:hypothetical protein
MKHGLNLGYQWSFEQGLELKIHMGIIIDQKA